MKNSNNQNGRSMIEMLGVLAIIGVLSVGGIAGYSKAMMKYRINKTIEQITLIAGNVRTFFASQGNYDGLDSVGDTGKAIIKKAKLVPDEIIEYYKEGTNVGKIKQLNNAFGGKYDISAIWKGDDDVKICGSNTGSCGYAFAIYMDKIPEEACIEIVSHNWDSVVKNTLIRTDARDENDRSFDKLAPLDIDTAVVACTDNDRIFLYFGIDPKSNEWGLSE